MTDQIPKSPISNDPSQDGSDMQAQFDHVLDLVRNTIKGTDYERFNAETENIETAFRWTIEREKYAEASVLFEKFADILLYQGKRDRLMGSVALVEGVLDRVEDTTVRCELAVTVGSYYRASDEAKKRDDVLRAIRLLEAMGKDQSAVEDAACNVRRLGELAAAYMSLFGIDQEEGHLEKALGSIQQTEQMVFDKTDPVVFGRLKRMLAQVHRELAAIEDPANHLHIAIGALESVVNRLHPDSERRDFVRVNTDLAMAYWKLAEYENRLENLLKSVNVNQITLAFVEDDGVGFQKGVVYNNLGIGHFSLSGITDRKRNIIEALEWFEKADDCADHHEADFKLRVWINQAGTYCMLADAENASVNLERGKTMAKRALALSDEEANPRLAGHIYCQLGSIQATLARHIEKPEKHLEEAAVVLKKALSLSPKHVTAVSKSQALGELGYVYLMLGRIKKQRCLSDEGVGYIYQSIVVAKAHGLVSRIGWAYMILSYRYVRSINPLMWLVGLYYLSWSTFYFARVGQSIAVVRNVRSIIGVVARTALFLMISFLVLRWVLG